MNSIPMPYHTGFCSATEVIANIVEVIGVHGALIDVVTTGNPVRGIAGWALGRLIRILNNHYCLNQNFPQAFLGNSEWQKGTDTFNALSIATHLIGRRWISNQKVDEKKVKRLLEQLKPIQEKIVQLESNFQHTFTEATKKARRAAQKNMKIKNTKNREKLKPLEQERTQIKAAIETIKFAPKASKIAFNFFSAITHLASFSLSIKTFNKQDEFHRLQFEHIFTQTEALSKKYHLPYARDASFSKNMDFLTVLLRDKLFPALDILLPEGTALVSKLSSTKNLMYKYYFAESDAESPFNKYLNWISQYENKKKELFPNLKADFSEILNDLKTLFNNHLQLKVNNMFFLESPKASQDISRFVENFDFYIRYTKQIFTFNQKVNEALEHAQATKEEKKEALKLTKKIVTNKKEHFAHLAPRTYSHFHQEDDQVKKKA